jgi:hypothetical protein
MVERVVEYEALYNQLTDIEMPPSLEYYWNVGFERGTLRGLLLMFNKVADPVVVMDVIEQICTRLNCRVQGITDYEVFQRRSYHLTEPVIVSMFFNEDANSCKFVQDGVQPAEPKYKFVCPDTEA